jgi:hypothetical protein
MSPFVAVPVKQPNLTRKFPLTDTLAGHMAAALTVSAACRWPSATSRSAELACHYCFVPEGRRS